MYKNYNQIVCVSNRIEKDFYQRFGKDCNVTTITNINDIEMIKEKAKMSRTIRKNRFTFVLVGRVDNEHKGFDRVLQATEQLNEDGYVFDVWVVGDGIDFEKLEEQKKN